jgi:hypothetical protein
MVIVACQACLERPLNTSFQIPFFVYMPMTKFRLSLAKSNTCIAKYNGQARPSKKQTEMACLMGKT